MNRKAYENEYRTTLVCIDDYSGEVLKGKFTNPYLDKSVTFESTMQFLTKMEQLLDGMNFPQPYLKVRTFTQPSVVEDADDRGGTATHGKCGTFAVRVIFRQNASWQGTVVWLEENKEESFRSVLELLLLMNGALSE